ncbi:hypothetical protein BGZ97_002184, partial [Linnemannia gamsii]
MKFTTAIIALSAVAALVQAGSPLPEPAGTVLQKVQDTVAGTGALTNGLGGLGGTQTQKRADPVTDLASGGPAAQGLGAVKNALKGAAPGTGAVTDALNGAAPGTGA